MRPCPSTSCRIRSFTTRSASFATSSTETEEFRQIANRISVLLVAEALRDLPTERAVVQTPLEKAEGRRVARDVVVVPVLRAGLGMLDAVLELLPARASATSVCSATNRPLSPRSITRSCPTIYRRAMSCWSIRCWRPAAARSPRSTC